MPEMNTYIPWDEYVATYNRMHKTNLKTPQAMLKTLYDQEQNVHKVGAILGLGGWTVCRYMGLWGLPRMPKGHRGQAPYQIAYRTIENPEQYTHREIAEIIGCTTGYIHFLKKSVAKWRLKNVQQ